jgi:lysozyme
MDIEALKTMLRRHEGLRLHVYQCTSGVDTVGFGHALLPHETFNEGITQEQAEFLLDGDIQTATARAVQWIGIECWRKLDDIRQQIIVDMVFNLGNRIWQFRKLRAAILNRNWPEATAQMIGSLWHQQTHGRAVELEHMMLTGETKEGG